MKTDSGHLTYCTNVHPGEDWSSHFAELINHLPRIKEQFCPVEKMGVGLRLSNQMSHDLIKEGMLDSFQSWLDKNEFYVFTVNGFPYGAFHDTVIKDNVHKPDWTQEDRKGYTLRLFEILKQLLPAEVEKGSISTSPLSYRHWFTNERDREKAMMTATEHIVEVAEYLHDIEQNEGQWLHLDIEPEPGGLIENGNEFIDWYESMLIPTGQTVLKHLEFDPEEIEQIIRNHIQLCYDVCHMSVEHEDQRQLINRLRKKEIPIGKIQLSSALRLPAGADPMVLKPFDEPQYLHQVVVKRRNGKLLRYKDLQDALVDAPEGEWRVHFHVPIFTRDYHTVSSTQDYIREILDIHRNTPLTDHLETETYTWRVLPDELQLPIDDSLVRELRYIQELIK